jgi:hypothetical protein
MSRYRSIVLSAFFAGSICSILFLGNSGQISGRMSAAQAQGANADPNSDLAELKAEIARLKTTTATAAAMNEVDYHAQNLWFSGRAGNWPLANFYWEKILLHMRGAKGTPPDGKEGASQQAKPEETASLIEKSPNMQVGNAIQRRDVVAFATTYRSLLEGCYNCHKAVGKPYLRPRMPVKPAQAIITVDPNATWPQ